jgi:hypothetical protein
LANVRHNFDHCDFLNGQIDAVAGVAHRADNPRVVLFVVEEDVARLTFVAVGSMEPVVEGHDIVPLFIHVVAGRLALVQAVFFPGGRPAVRGVV